MLRLMSYVRIEEENITGDILFTGKFPDHLLIF
jgi:hypothetical protein